MSAPAGNAYASVRNAAAIVEALAGAVPEGLANKDIAAAARITPAQVTRLCEPLIEVGWVRKLDTGHYCITAKVGAMAARVSVSLGAAQQRLADLTRNYTNPHL